MEVLYSLRLILLSLLAFTFNSIHVEALAGSKLCSACRAVINDAEWAVQQVDPKKRVQIGSFRVDSQGNQNVKEKKFARSESHITEVIDGICEKMTEYAEATNDDGSKEIVRTRSHDGKMLKTRHLNLDREAGGVLKYRCHDFLEDHEEDVIELLQQENLRDHENAICVDETKACTRDEIAKPLMVLPEVTFEQTEDKTDNDTEGEADNAGLEDDDDEEEDITESDSDDQSEKEEL